MRRPASSPTIIIICRVRKKHHQQYQHHQLNLNHHNPNRPPLPTSSPTIIVIIIINVIIIVIIIVNSNINIFILVSTTPIARPSPPHHNLDLKALIWSTFPLCASSPQNGGFTIRCFGTFCIIMGSSGLLQKAIDRLVPVQFQPVLARYAVLL